MGALYAGGNLWPREDPLLHTTVLRAPVPHEWLFQVTLYAVKQVAGFPGLRVLHVLAVAGIVAFAFAQLRRASGDLAAAATGTLVLIALSWFRWIQLRPDLVTVLAILALYAWLLRDPRPPGAGRIAAGLSLMLVWVNAHSLFAIGLCLVLAAAAGTLLHALLGLLARTPEWGRDANAARGRRLLLFLGLAILVTWLNPRGFEQHLTFLTQSNAGLIWRIRDDFMRYHPFALPPQGVLAFTPLAFCLSDLLYAAFFASAGFRLLRYLRARDAATLERFDAVHFGLGLAAFVASLVAVRFHWLALFPLLYLLRPLAAARMTPVWRTLLAGASVAIAVALPVAADLPAFVAEVAREPGGYWHSDWLDVRYCGSGARFLADAGLEGRLYNPFNLGGFLGYWLAPRLRTFIDGRLDHVPVEVLDDYLAIRRTSRRGPSKPLRRRLDRWGIDLFFADTFPEAWYADRESGYHLRRLPEWMPIWVTRTHAIYLRRNPRNRRNLERVAAYYAARGIPFDRSKGFDVSRVIEAAPAFAAEHQLVLPDRALLERDAASPDRTLAARGLEALAHHAWRVGDFAGQLPWERALHALRPEDRDSALRLADALLQLHKPRQALPVAEDLARREPGDLEAAELLAAARYETGLTPPGAKAVLGGD